MKPKYLRHTLKVIESGEVEIETLSFTKKRFRLTGRQLHAKLRELAGWEPADKFAHVMNQLAKGRVYQIEPRRGEESAPKELIHYSREAATDAQPSRLGSWFNERAERWEQQSRIHTAPAAKFLHKDHMAILSRGWEVVPLILKRLETSTSDWLWSLEQIIGEDDNPARGCEDYSSARRAWLEWGKRRYPL